VRTDRSGHHARRYCLALYPEFLFVREEGVLMSLKYPFDDAVVFILGSLFGSFANVCLYRLPQRFFADRILY
jgi:hypothetical protein